MSAPAPVESRSLVTELWALVRSITEARDVDLDLRLTGKPSDVPDRVHRLILDALHPVLSSARTAGEMHHLALELAFEALSLSVRIEHDAELSPGERRDTEQAMLASYERIGEAGGSLALSSGRGYGMRVELTIPLTPQASPDRTAPRTDDLPPRPVRAGLATDSSTQYERLTPQEEVALSLLSAGFSNKEIAARMNIGVGTVKYHLAQIYQKLDVQGRGRGAAVARARELGLIFD
ncbi:MAG TPA: LuxR C-terminal-related transcriptional regulator [Chloroflexia bacterium]|nr:LuxR C-terminal-related transcriptional regulator [Chloroflexia bacterium]